MLPGLLNISILFLTSKKNTYSKVPENHSILFPYRISKSDIKWIMNANKEIPCAEVFPPLPHNPTNKNLRYSLHKSKNVMEFMLLQLSLYDELH